MDKKPSIFQNEPKVLPVIVKSNPSQQDINTPQLTSRHLHIKRHRCPRPNFLDGLSSLWACIPPLLWSRCSFRLNVRRQCKCIELLQQSRQKICRFIVCIVLPHTLQKYDFRQRQRWIVHNSSFGLTMRGPALNGVNIMGFAVNLARRAGSNHRSGSNMSASKPHRAVLRWVKMGKYMKVVLFGI